MLRSHQRQLHANQYRKERHKTTRSPWVPFQKKGVAAAIVHEVLHAYLDYTIPLADAPENLFIISKKGDTVSLFTYHYYQDDIPRYPDLPDSLPGYITKEKYTRDGIRIDPFLKSRTLPKKKAKSYGRH